MRELSLFSGAGGGLLGTYLLGWQPIGYVEWNDYCQRVIAARIRDGILPAAPIFGDIRTFTSEGYAAGYTGLVDIITGGFPCQPFSIAGARLGADDPRNMWPATIECIRVVRPRFCLLENVPGLLTTGYFGTVLGDLAASGYDVRWRVLSAAEMGAPHLRDRLWIVAYADGSRCGKQNAFRSDCHIEWNDTTQEQDRRSEQGQPVADREVSNSNSDNEYRRSGNVQMGREWCSINVAENSATRRNQWSTEPTMGRVAYGVAYRMDRISALGNGQVPAVVRAAWLLLNESIYRPCRDKA